MPATLRLVAVGGEAAPVVAALQGATGLEVEVLGQLSSLKVLMGIGPDLAVDVVAWWTWDPQAEWEDLRALGRLRPRAAVLAVVRDAEAVGRAGLACEELRSRGELGAVAVAFPERASLHAAALRLASLQGWPIANGHRPDPGAAAAGMARPGPEVRVVAVFGPKGGCGKTTLAVELAACAAAGRAGECALVDLDLEASDAAPMVGADGVPDVVDLLPRLGEEGKAALTLSPCPRGGFHLVPGPARPELAGLVRPQHVQRLLEELRRCYRLTVVDAGGRLSDDAACAALEVADRILLVTAPDPCGLRRTALALELMGRAGWRPAERVGVAVNGVGGHTALTRGQVEAFLGVPVVAWLPWDREALHRSFLAGVPLARRRPDHLLVRELRRVLEIWGIPAAQGGPARGGRAAWWSMRRAAAGG